MLSMLSNLVLLLRKWRIGCFEESSNESALEKVVELLMLMARSHLL
jgi:hypothetical protein